MLGKSCICMQFQSNLWCFNPFGSEIAKGLVYLIELTISEMLESSKIYSASSSKCLFPNKNTGFLCILASSNRVRYFTKLVFINVTIQTKKV